LVSLNKTGKNLKTDKPEAAENLQQLLSVFDDIHNLCDELSRLNYILKRKRIEIIINYQNKGKIISALRNCFDMTAARAAKKEEVVSALRSRFDMTAARAAKKEEEK
jgi:hypothetical protein